MSLTEEITNLREQALNELDSISDERSLEGWRVTFLARRGRLADIISQIPSLPVEERPAVGKMANALKAELQQLYESKLSDIRRSAISQVDVTLPGIPPMVGGLHITRQTIYEMVRIFGEMGFSVYEGNEVETDEYNFSLLNIPQEHPARDMWDTIYIDDKLLLATHTSPGQIHVMRKYCPQPIRFVLPGKVHRYEAVSARRESMFYQLEGLAIGEGITLATLKGTFENFARQLFGPDRKLRFRGSYFPFTEPSVEIDITCSCLGKGCILCKGSGWLEIAGGGMVHPVVLRNGGYDPSKVSGFAFGFGVERSVMPRFGIDDIRLFYGNDLRFLRQFS